MWPVQFIVQQSEMCHLETFHWQSIKVLFEHGQKADFVLE